MTLTVATWRLTRPRKTNPGRHQLLTMKLLSMHLVQQTRGMFPTLQARGMSPIPAAVSLTSEQTEIRAWFRAHQDRVCQLDDGFIRWLSRLLDQNRITPAEMGPLRMLTYRYQDYAQHGSVDTREEVFLCFATASFSEDCTNPAVWTTST